MPEPTDIIRFVEAVRGAAVHEDEGITFGNRRANLTGVTVAWMVNPDSIAAAVEAGHNCIVHHEALTYPYPGLPPIRERHYLSWPTNAQRLRLLSAHGITTLRLHASLDELYIFDTFAEQLALGVPIAGDDSGVFSHKVYASPVGTFGELLEHVKRAMNMPALRTTREDPARPVERTGVPWGGLGLFVNVAFMQALIDIGVDTLICGETDSYGLRFAAELGIAVIETSHELSEDRGLKRFADTLHAALTLPVRHVETANIWTMS